MNSDDLETYRHDPDIVPAEIHHTTKDIIDRGKAKHIPTGEMTTEQTANQRQIEILRETLVQKAISEKVVKPPKPYWKIKRDERKAGKK